MDNATEGIPPTSHRSICTPTWGPQKGDHEFVVNIHKAIGDLADPNTPIGIKPALQRLLLECDHYLIYGNETVLIKLCLDAIEVCRQGWNYFSCWISSSQNICYSIYWALKAALEQHHKTALKSELEQNLALTNDPAFSKRNII